MIFVVKLVYGIKQIVEKQYFYYKTKWSVLHRKA